METAFRLTPALILPYQQSCSRRAFQSVERKDWLIKRRALGGRLRGEAWVRYLSEAFKAYHSWIRDEGSAARGFSHAPPSNGQT